MNTSFRRILFTSLLATTALVSLFPLGATPIAVTGGSGVDAAPPLFIPGNGGAAVALDTTGALNAYASANGAPLAPVPQPGTLPVFAGGLAMLAVLLRRRRGGSIAGTQRREGPSRRPAAPDLARVGEVPFLWDRRLRMLGSPLAISMPILLVTAATAVADPVFSINATLTLPESVTPIIGSQGTPIVDGQTQSAGIPGAAVTATFGVVAKDGNLGSLSDVSALAPGASISGGANAISDVALDNIKIIAPGLAAGTEVKYSINFGIDGSIAVSAFGNSTARAIVSLAYAAAPQNGVTLGEVVASTNPGDDAANGIFSAGVRGVKATTPVETGFVDNDVFAEFILATNAFAAASPSSTTQGQASATSDFLDPFSFPGTGPVFNFFDANGDPLTGVTADSTDGCIVNNQFLCGPAPTTPTSVPEPSTLPILAAGLAALALLTAAAPRKSPLGRS